MAKTIIRMIKGRLVPIRVSSKDITRRVKGKPDAIVRESKWDSPRGYSVDEFRVFRQGKKTENLFHVKVANSRIVDFSQWSGRGKLTRKEAAAMLKRFRTEKRVFAPGILDKFKQKVLGKK